MPVNLSWLRAGNDKKKMKDDDFAEEEDEQAQEEEELEEDEEAEEDDDEEAEEDDEEEAEEDDDEEAEDDDEEAEDMPKKKMKKKAKSKKYNSSYRRGVSAGKAKERKRIKAILQIAQSPQAEGYVKFIKAALFDGKTTAAQLSYDIMSDFSSNRGVTMRDLRSGAKKVDNKSAKRNKKQEAKKAVGNMAAGMSKIGRRIN